MNDLEFGTRNKRGDWSPNQHPQVAFFWSRPFDLRAWGKFLIGYAWPWNAFHVAVTLLYWYVLLPDWETMKTLSWGWVLWLYMVNGVGIFLMYGSIEAVYYWKRRQGTRFKYNAKFPYEQPSDVFWFKSQNIDNFLRTYLSGIVFWTLVEVILLWSFANGLAPWLSWTENPYHLALLVFITPMIHEVHFFLIHRLIHTPFLYKWVHSVHHNSVNPSPWSSLSMHPVETFLYHAVALWHLVIPSNPLIGLLQLNMAGYGALNGHIGFDKLEITDNATLDSHAYVHYLHHKYFEVNYGGDGLIPLDQWFGTWHDGSREGQERMEARHARKVARMNKAGA
ncbi:sterol desaturase family protein [Aestuariivirga sp.]|jgi:sterol desaturase/sphingolipid hydroxylase (fatty acid hydroxylase superfamily)|uniref:sterol desaturase family protein n=1 Tax=Aestuariivirga sp. TaxID=2650926 RepID=UPI003784E39A